MKRSVFVLMTSIFLFALQATSQERPFRFGLHIAPNISWMKPDVQGEIYKSDGSSVKISYGAAFEYAFTPNIGIVTGINILQAGGRLQFRHVGEYAVNSAVVVDTGILFRKYNLQYLEIPLMLKGSTGDLLGKFSFFGKFGIGSGFNIKARADDAFQPENIKTGEKITTENVNIKDRISFFRESMIIGIGSEYRLGNTAVITMGVTFSNGFTNVLKGTNTFNPDAKEKARSNLMELNVGIMF